MSTDATCGTCPFWTLLESDPARDTMRPGIVRGHCHHACATRDESQTRWADWWCSEHPLRQRDRLAAMAIQAAARRWLSDEWDRDTPGVMAQDAYAIADAMLAERAKEGTP